MMQFKKKCGNCEYWVDEVCVNAYSDHRADFTDNDFVCEYHEWSCLTVNEAVAIVRDELLKHGELYDGFLSSITSAVNEAWVFASEETKASISKHILERIIGEEHED